MQQVLTNVKMEAFMKVRVLKTLVEKNENSIDARNTLAYIMAKANVDLKDAKKIIEKAIERNTDLKAASTLKGTLGFIQLQRGDKEEALENLKVAYDSGDPDADIVRDFAQALIANGHWNDARSILKRASENLHFYKATRAEFRNKYKEILDRAPADQE
jgi:tetratricopeptide (TPR) repeat protein